MNVQQLKELVDSLLSYESTNGIQNLTNDLRDRFNDLSSNPQNPDIQLSAKNSFDQLMQVLLRVENIYTPAQKELMSEIGASEFFQSDIGEIITSSSRDNAMTPAATLQVVEDYRTRREIYIETLRRLSADLGSLHVEAYQPTPGSADLGFTLPREIFDNEFDGLIKRLGDVRRIIRTFSEVATGHVERVEVKSISTTDPVFFLTTCLSTATLIGGAFTWALAQWKTVEEIRKLRAETKKIGVFTDKEAEEIFGTKIVQTIDAAVKTETARLFDQAKAEGRTAELQNATAIVLRDILSMVERGVTLQIKFDPSSIPAVAPDGEEIDQVNAGQLTSLARGLNFPPPSPDPILSLPSNEDEK